MHAPSRRIRYAVVGAGNIAQAAVMPAFDHTDKNSSLVAVISSDPDKRAALVKRYKLELEGGYLEFESVLDRGRIDAVYIATPTSLHKEFTLRAAALGVHVLCEKPLAPSVADAREMEEACKDRAVKLMVAYRLHFEEATLKALDIARSGELGELRLFESFLSRDRSYYLRADEGPGGSAALELGVYCINAARNLFGVEPYSVYAAALEVHGADDTTTAILRFPGGPIAQFCVSNSVARVSSYRIAGSRGDLRLEPAYDFSEGLTHFLTIAGESKRTAFKKHAQFATEISYFSSCILDDLTPEPSAEEAIGDLRVVEAMFESIRTGSSVELPPYRRHRWPTLTEQRHDPPIVEPSLAER
ncbi:MAG TPA: Gfo/Idh/MocA family oxidoreductase [Polyangiaceae bacterium]|jgi:predicted dehydrogenase